MRSFGLFFIEFLSEFDADVSEAAVITSLQNAVLAVTSLPALMIGLKYFSERQLSFFGFLLSIIGYALSSFATSLNFMIFSISILVGAGNAIGFSPVFISLGKHFDKRRGFANGLMVSGSCIGSLSLPPLIRYFLDAYGLRGALLLTAGVYAHILPFTLLLRPESFYNRNTTSYLNSSENGEPLLVYETKEGDTIKVLDISVSTSEPDVRQQNKHRNKRRTNTISEGTVVEKRYRQYLSNSSLILSSTISDLAWETFEEKSNDEKNTSFKETCKKLCDLTVLKRLQFVFFLIYFSLSSIPGGLGFIFIPTYAKDKGLTNSEIVLMLGIMAGSDFVGRISCGFLADLPQIRMTHILLVSQTVMAITANCARFLTAYFHFYLFVIAYGMFSGMPSSLCGSLVSRICGLEHFPTGFGLMILPHQGMLSGSSLIIGR
ncbi:hypothetical protein FSP39_000746 [Pinctada imbricata]|uniref:Uncharacterized protein n=1 Tax=Pinctada imbricata TaxID=66713 RepID=A0AA88XXI3_PINIB|nr:hypothetical protein FSP39_000746 [Pinctada imbricata]